MVEKQILDKIDVTFNELLAYIENTVQEYPSNARYLAYVKKSYLVFKATQDEVAPEGYLKIAPLIGGVSRCADHSFEGELYPEGQEFDDYLNKLTKLVYQLEQTKGLV